MLAANRLHGGHTGSGVENHSLAGKDAIKVIQIIVNGTATPEAVKA